VAPTHVVVQHLAPSGGLLRGLRSGYAWCCSWHRPVAVPPWPRNMVWATVARVIRVPDVLVQTSIALYLL